MSIHITDQFIHRMSTDNRLTPVHLAIAMAFLNACLRQGSRQSFSISRRQLMLASRVKSFTTYHKVIKDFQQFGYILYQPSYHPKNGSQVTILSEPNNLQ